MTWAEVIRKLKAAGFIEVRSGKGSHLLLKHPISGKGNHDPKSDALAFDLELAPA